MDDLAIDAALEGRRADRYMFTSPLGKRTETYLRARLRDACGLPDDMARIAIATIVARLTAALGAGRRIEIQGFGILHPHWHWGRWNWNVHLNMKVYTPAYLTVLYRPPRELYGYRYIAYRFGSTLSRHLDSTPTRASSPKLLAKLQHKDKVGIAWLRAHTREIMAAEKRAWERNQERCGLDDGQTFTDSPEYRRRKAWIAKIRRMKPMLSGPR
jgi:nucleoid DNA-binding protein